MGWVDDYSNSTIRNKKRHGADVQKCRQFWEKRIEYWVIGEMLKEGLDVYVPLVDDDAIDAVIRREDKTFITVQIKARSRTVGDRDAALFAAIPHELRDNYWFVFYSERMDMKWIMTSEEFIRESVQNKSGKNKGKRSIWFNGGKNRTRIPDRRLSTARNTL